MLVLATSGGSVDICCCSILTSHHFTLFHSYFRLWHSFFASFKSCLLQYSRSPATRMASFTRINVDSLHNTASLCSCFCTQLLRCIMRTCTRSFIKFGEEMSSRQGEHRWIPVTKMLFDVIFGCIFAAKIQLDSFDPQNIVWIKYIPLFYNLQK